MKCLLILFMVQLAPLPGASSPSKVALFDLSIASQDVAAIHVLLVSSGGSVHPDRVLAEYEKTKIQSKLASLTKAGVFRYASAQLMLDDLNPDLMNAISDFSKSIKGQYGRYGAKEVMGIGIPLLVHKFDDDGSPYTMHIRLPTDLIGAYVGLLRSHGVEVRYDEER